MGGSDGWSVVEAHVPEAELATFAADLRSLTSAAARSTGAPTTTTRCPTRSPPG